VGRLGTARQPVTHRDIGGGDHRPSDRRTGNRQGPRHRDLAPTPRSARDTEWYAHDGAAVVARPDILRLRTNCPRQGLDKTDLLGRFRKTTDLTVANNVAWPSVLAAGEEPNLSETVCLAELAVNRAPDDRKGRILNTLGAAPYRARRYAGMSLRSAS
jgi:hypothetical protein